MFRFGSSSLRITARVALMMPAPMRTTSGLDEPFAAVFEERSITVFPLLFSIAISPLGVCCYRKYCLRKRRPVSGLGFPDGRRAAPVGLRSEFQACPRGRNPDCHP